MPPRCVHLATILICANVLLWAVLVPLGGFALNAIHPKSAGESPLLSLMAGTAYFAFVVPVVLLAVLLYYELRQGRRWATLTFD